ncbi:MlaE family ABC transporter permease [Acidicapsa ligni]|uniref:MlaE family ABC transporter permease n=1 Tax=Acidicapsa ligni TaxID=542300 RepID=UPI0021DFFBC0|nr:ABC transporter permease [Acidicapsa ligni]
MSAPLAAVGKATFGLLDYFGGLSGQIWASTRALPATMPLIGNKYRWKASVRQMMQIGVDAFPMVALMSLCSGFILALQGAGELRKFGAINFVIDLVAVGFTRELGPLITALAVSGRSGSAFSAEIGTMVVTEEMDALRVMAFEPVEFVLAPKFLATLVAVPCLSIFANMSGILAGGIFMFFIAHLPLEQFVKLALNAIQMQDIVSGLIKSTAFATVIVQVGCFEGFRVRGGPESVGIATTAAVVKSTFLVIIVDAIFTAIFYFMGIS